MTRRSQCSSKICAMPLRPSCKRPWLGATQKDTVRELDAKLASLEGIVRVGVGLFAFGLASIFYPPPKLLPVNFRSILPAIAQAN
jgi:hypothetical protein